MKPPNEPPTDLIKPEPAPAALESVERPQSYNYGVDPNAQNEVHLIDYWRAIRKRLWMVLGLVALITMLAVLYVARKPDYFEAQARVQVKPEDNSTLSGKPPYFYSASEESVYFNTQLQILTSQGLLRRVVRTLDLEHNPDFFKGSTAQKRSTWRTILEMTGISQRESSTAEKPEELPVAASAVAPASSREDLAEAKRLQPYVGAIIAGLKVEPVKEARGYYKETSLIDIRYSHTDPQVAAKVVNAIADTYVYANLEKKMETNSSTGTFLQKRIAELQQQIRTDEERLVNYARNNQIISLDPTQNTVVERLAGLNRQLLEAENDRKTAEAAFNAASIPGAAEALAENDAKQVSDLDTKLNDLRQKRAQLLVEATEEAPEVKEVDQQITELNKQLKDLRSRKSTTLLATLETKYKQALGREQALRQSFNAQRAETLTQNEAAINARIIQQEIDTNKALLNSLLQGAKENDVVIAGKPNNISVVDYGLAPDAPIGPNRTRTVFTAFFLSIGLGIGFALFLEYLDDSVRTTEEVERGLHLPALAVIPSVGGVAKNRLLGTSKALLRRNGNSHSDSREELLINADSRSPLAEAYRHLRTSVLLSSAGRAPKALLVTSSLPGEGKTTTAVNTASILAQTGASVVIVDADMRRPRLHSIFDVPDQLGLSSILSSSVSDDEIVAMINLDEAKGVNVLTSGPIPPNPAELIGSDQMRHLMTLLQSKFDHVIIDSPPVSSFTDGVLISTMVDGVLLVVHGGKSSRHIVRRAKQLLQEVGAKIFGVVLNNTQVQTHDYYHYQRYYSEKYYGQRTSA
ncbi:MAG TPA: polysaccharide biosynthesis tyrosine autokinase [Pyrinomonadaceae bacterium]|nr:polysaccharide biosynthesis tyrosine autokinase [Pyrinomonadaceae bacterium]